VLEFCTLSLLWTVVCVCGQCDNASQLAGGTQVERRDVWSTQRVNVRPSRWLPRRPVPRWPWHAWRSLQRYITIKNGKGSPYSITDRRVPELIPVLGSRPAGNVSHKRGGRLPLLTARPAVTPTTLKRAAW